MTKGRKDSGKSLIMLSPAIGGMDTFSSPRFLCDLPINTTISYYAFSDTSHQPDRKAAILTMQAWKRVFLSAPDLSKVIFDTSTPALASAVFEVFTVMVHKTPIMCTPLLLLEPSNFDDANIDIMCTQEPTTKINLLILYTRRAVKYGERPKFSLWEYGSPLVNRRLKCAYCKRLGFENIEIEPYAAELDKLCSELKTCRTTCLDLLNNHMVLLSIVSLSERLFETIHVSTMLSNCPKRPSEKDVLACACWCSVDKIPFETSDLHKTAHIAHSLHYLLCYYIIHEPTKSEEHVVLLGYVTRVLLHCLPFWSEVVYAAVTMVHQLTVRANWRSEWEEVFEYLKTCNDSTRMWAHKHIRNRNKYL